MSEILQSQENIRDQEDWHWQVRHSITSIDQLSGYLNLSESEKQEMEKVCKVFPFRITPYYLGLINREDPKDPLRFQMIPDKRELTELEDRAKTEGKTLEVLLSELSYENRIGGWDKPEQFIDRERSVEQKYPNRVAWLITRECPAWCRFCVRKVMSEDSIVPKLSREKIDSALEAIGKNPKINDVLITGGDAFMLPSQTIEEILAKLLEINHIKTIRFGTRTPVTLPQRIISDPQLAQILKEKTEQAHEQEKNIWVMTQFNHPREITEESKRSIKILRESGCQLGNQTVLLKGVNNDIETLEKLFHQIACLGIRPYYLYQGIPTPGTNFRYPPISRGLEIMRQMYERQNLSGIEKPRYILADSEVGKIVLPPPGVVYRISEKQDQSGNVYEIFEFTWKGKNIKYRALKE